MSKSIGPLGLPAVDLPSLIIANPGAEFGIDTKIGRLQAMASQSIARGGASLATLRRYNRNEHISSETRNSLVTMDEWPSREVSELLPREGGAVIGIDLGGSATMPKLLDRG